MLPRQEHFDGGIALFAVGGVAPQLEDDGLPIVGVGQGMTKQNRLHELPHPWYPHAVEGHGGAHVRLLAAGALRVAATLQGGDDLGSQCDRREGRGRSGH